MSASVAFANEAVHTTDSTRFWIGGTFADTTRAATVSPWSWGHHWVWLLPLGILLASLVMPAAPRSHRTVWLVPAILMTLTLPPLLALAVPAPGTGPPVLGSGPIAFVLGNVYVLIFASTLTATVVHLLSTAAMPSREGSLPARPATPSRAG